LKFGGIIARKLRRGRPRPDGRWHLDEVFVSINGRQLDASKNLPFSPRM
jgi:putative transposase